MFSAARRALAAISAASSSVRSGSWLITDITMLIIICRRRSRRASSIPSLCSPPVGSACDAMPDLALLFSPFLLFSSLWMLAAAPALRPNRSIVPPSVHEAIAHWPYTLVTRRQRCRDCRNLLLDHFTEDE